jgi:hypothetical protein
MPLLRAWYAKSWLGTLSTVLRGIAKWVTGIFRLLGWRLSGLQESSASVTSCQCCVSSPGARWTTPLAEHRDE